MQPFVGNFVGNFIGKLPHSRLLPLPFRRERDGQRGSVRSCSPLPFAILVSRRCLLPLPIGWEEGRGSVQQRSAGLLTYLPNALPGCLWYVVGQRHFRRDMSLRNGRLC